jgi:hypothetical protein
MQNQGVPPTVVIAAVGGLLTLIGVFLPWVSGGLSDPTINGTKASYFTGNVIIVLSLISLMSMGAIYALEDHAAILGATILASSLGLITLFMAIGNFSDVRNFLAQSSPDASVEIGIYVVLVGAIVLTAFSGFYVLQTIQEGKSMQEAKGEE